jgi:hypothetical protein
MNKISELSPFGEQLRLQTSHIFQWYMSYVKKIVATLAWLVNDPLRGSERPHTKRRASFPGEDSFKCIKADISAAARFWPSL